MRTIISRNARHFSYDTRKRFRHNARFVVDGKRGNYGDDYFHLRSEFRGDAKSTWRSFSIAFLTTTTTVYQPLLHVVNSTRWFVCEHTRHNELDETNARMIGGRWSATISSGEKLLSRHRTLRDRDRTRSITPGTYFRHSRNRSTTTRIARSRDENATRKRGKRGTSHAARLRNSAPECTASAPRAGYGLGRRTHARRVAAITAPTVSTATRVLRDLWSLFTRVTRCANPGSRIRIHIHISSGILKKKIKNIIFK